MQSPAWSDTLIVRQDGSGHYTSLQDAINASVDGDEILVFPGTWIGPFSWLSKTLVIRSALGREQTILSGDGTSRVMHVESLSAPGSRLEGFTLRDGVLDGGGILAVNSGAGLLVVSAHLSVVDCAIDDNEVSTTWGGAWSPNVWGGAAGVTILDSSIVDFIGCTVSGNVSLLAFMAYGANGGVRGAGMHIDQSAVVLERCLIDSNLALAESFAPNCANCNGSSGLGAGLWVGETAQVHIVESTFKSNRCAGQNARSGRGAALYTEGTLTLDGCFFTQNTCDVPTNCYCGSESAYGGALHVAAGTSTVSGCYIWSNSVENAHDNLGGGIYVDDSLATLTVSTTAFCSNSPSHIEGAWVDGGQVTQDSACSDCNGNGVYDPFDIDSRMAHDCDGNGLIDSCEITAAPSLDLDLNGILDACEASGTHWFHSPVTSGLYTMLAPSDWEKAQLQAEGLGGALVTVRSDIENDWLQGVFPGPRFWIGYSDLEVEGDFVWDSEETPGYENWAAGAPGQFTQDQDFVALNPHTGTWDTWFSYSDYRSVVEAHDCDQNFEADRMQIASDPSLDMNGDGLMDSCSPPSYCVGVPNSSGLGGSITALGSPEIGANNFTLHATDLPPFQWSYFLTSRTQDHVPNFGARQGILCVGAPIVRFAIPGTGQIDQTTIDGSRTFTLDLDHLPHMTVFLPGETWNFQLWFRDVNPSLTSNTTNGVTVMFR